MVHDSISRKRLVVQTEEDEVQRPQSGSKLLVPGKRQLAEDNKAWGMVGKSSPDQYGRLS
jgi:hypothetical protein